ncbi:MAG: sigma-70 family RNA polymerase sigma factor [Lachnospiraceae bacterium]|nr:sigma-70 family RNA polymerase sigma factor [Lachnospiraceae bacterium]
MEALRIETENEITEEEARALIEKHERLIAWLARRAKREYRIMPWDAIDEDDLMQEGRLALLDAARGYDETRGARFTTYAYVTIRNAMNDLWEEHKKSFEREKQKEGMIPIFLNDGKSDWVSTEGTVNVSFHDRTGRDALMHVTLMKLKRRFDKLSRKQQRVLWRRYGLGNLDAETVSETAKYFHLAKSSAKKIEAQALANLREMMAVGLRD